MRQARRRRRSGTRAQALAEFALVVPVFVLILAGIVQLGVLLWGQNTLNQLARDTGRYAATLCPPGGETAAETWFGTLFTQAGGPWKNQTSDVVYTPAACPDDNTTQTWVTVTAAFDVPVFFPVVPGGGHLTTATQFRVEPAP